MDESRSSQSYYSGNHSGYVDSSHSLLDTESTQGNSSRYDSNNSSRGYNSSDEHPRMTYFHFILFLIVFFFHFSETFIEYLCYLDAISGSEDSSSVNFQNFQSTLLDYFYDIASRGIFSLISFFSRISQRS